MLMYWLNLFFSIMGFFFIYYFFGFLTSIQLTEELIHYDLSCSKYIFHLLVQDEHQCVEEVAIMSFTFNS